MRSILVALATVFTCAAPAAHAQVDGRYDGRIRCDAIPGTTTVALDTALTLTIAGGQATYSREVLRTDSREPAGVTERGSGRVEGDGALTLQGGATGANWSYEASYAGRMENGVVRLGGSQTWRFRQAAVHNRPCTIEARRAG